MIITYGDLNKQKAMQAFPLMREIEPGLDMAAWAAYAGGLIGEGDRLSGVFGAQRDHYIRGVFCYEVEPGLPGGSLLHIRNFVVLDMVQQEAIADILYHAIGDIARRNNCSAVRIHLPQKSYWAAQGFQKRGYRVDTCNFACGKSSGSLL